MKQIPTTPNDRPEKDAVLHIAVRTLTALLILLAGLLATGRANAQCDTWTSVGLPQSGITFNKIKVDHNGTAYVVCSGSVKL
jgi:hypothetical protein